ncbi:MAG TPA: RNA 2',3'-cyclic phosphodiesterase [Thermodesulfobacteriota bacterium]|nr:RNA 2',3'-cyclic phosphodiesterase [Thermodesulfobacteriota bacterium]
MRIFIAAKLPDETIEHIEDYIDSISNRVSGVKWEKPEKLHITLKFLGNIDDNQLSAVNDVISESVSNICRINMTVSHFGAFPGLSRLKILYVGFDKSQQITDLQSSIDKGLATIGFEREAREFIPHVTIARVKSRCKINPPLPIIEQKASEIERIAVVKSSLTSSGSEYQNLFVYELS